MQTVRRHATDRRVNGCADQAPSRCHWSRLSRTQHGARLLPCAAAPPQRGTVKAGAGVAHSHGMLGKITTGAASLALAISMVAAGWPAPAPAVTPEQLLFLEAWRAVDRAYVDKSFNGQSWFRVREQYLKSEAMDNREQTYAAINKLVSSLDDPFTRFLPPDRLAALRRGNSGSVTGVGVEVTYPADDAKSRDLVVVTPLPGGPADAAGVRAGDSIVSIDGKPTQGLSLYEASDLLLGEVGSEVQLTLRHAGKQATETLTLTRQKLNVSTVSSALCTDVSASVGPSSAGTGSLGYIRLATFNGNTAGAFTQALKSLKEQGADRLVLDIRNNGGGLFPAGVQVARSLINSGDIVLIADANGVRDIYSANGGALDSFTPMSVLVNKGTASASEVLAGALQDSGRATIAGESRTFGKGLIQTIVDLSDGSGVAVTVARYQTPAGTDINRVGIAPDLKVEADTIPTSGASNVCKVLQASDAPRLFK